MHYLKYLCIPNKEIKSFFNLLIKFKLMHSYIMQTTKTCLIYDIKTSKKINKVSIICSMFILRIINFYKTTSFRINCCLQFFIYMYYIFNNIIFTTK